MQVRLAAVAGVLASLLGSVTSPATATQPVEYSRAASYWYIPTKTENIYRMYHLDVVTTKNMTTGEVDSTARLVIDKCKRFASDALACGRDRRQLRSDSAILDFAPDLSRGTVSVEFDGDTYGVHLEMGDRSMGLFDKGRRCNETDVQEVAGLFSNMEVARGRLPGRKLRGPYEPTLDHAWLERGYGNWC